MLRRHSPFAAVALQLLLPLAGALPVAAQDLIPVEPGATITRDLASDGKDVFAIALAADRFVYGVAFQQSVDVVVTVYGPDEEILGAFDSPARGPEAFQFDTDVAGVHRVEITPFEGATGTYTLTVLRVEPRAATAEGRVDQLMAAFDGDDVPGGVVAVTRGGRMVFARAYGMADIATGTHFTVEHLSNIGSVSKQFTAFAISLLEARGQLSVDDDVRDYIPELPDLGARVTVRNLLNHTSGYREIFNTLSMGGWLGEDHLDHRAAIHLIQRQPELQFPPGSEYLYNNSGYMLLAEIVQRVSGQPFAAFMRTNIFEPVGMVHTTIMLEQGQIVPGATQGYTFADSGGYRESVDFDAAYGASSIYTSVADLALWLANFHDPVVGGSAVVARMVERGVLTGGDTTGYARGLAIGEYRGLRRISHGGADIAHRTQLAYYPELDAGVIVMSNNASFPSGAILNAVTDAFFAEQLEEEETGDAPAQEGEFDPADFDPETFDLYAGDFELAELAGFVLSLSRDGNRYYLQATGQPQVEIRPTSDATFAVVGVPAALTFYREGDQVDSLTLHQGGDHPATRVGAAAWDPSAAELEGYTGRYFSEELEAFYALELDDGKLVARHRRLDPITMSPGKRDEFAGGYPLNTLVFERGGDGRVTGFRASNGRTRRVWFAKME